MSYPYTVRELRTEMWLNALAARDELKKVNQYAEETPLSKLDREAVDEAWIAIDVLCERLGDA